MSAISNNSARGTLPQSYSDFQTASYASRSSQMSAYEELSAGLTIQTREGDVVTLSSSSYSGFSASSYNSQGIIESDSGSAMMNVHSREITLASGESFSFSVQGDLSEEELADIENIIKGIDGIVSEVAQGDMDEAIAKAFSMGPYDSISMYAADISYARSYSMSEQTSSYGSLLDSASSAPLIGPSNSQGGLESLFDKMAQLLESQEEKLLEKSWQPMDSLFQQYLNGMEASDEAEAGDSSGQAQTRGVALLDKIKQRLDEMIADLLDGAFDSTLDQYL